VSFGSDDARHMARALTLARRGLYTTDPNPRVGCVIVSEGRVVGEGWHERAGEPHAEIHALREAGESARGATVYLTLEPCCHHGRTPPCSDALIRAGITRLVAAMRDPNPQVAGQGFAQLQQHGIAAEYGLMQAEAEALNPGFVERMQRARPFVRVKLAASLDGRTALANGASKWITGEAARADVQKWRARSSAILTGIGTVLADDPALTVRSLDIGRQPLRVVVDSGLRCPPTARLLREPGRTLIVASHDRARRAQALQDAGAEVMVQNNASARVDLGGLMTELAAREINELLVEAGASLCGALLRAGLVNELLLYYAPHIMGDGERGMFQIGPLAEMRDRIALDVTDMRRIGRDLRIIARPAAG
jgi:diaminohydroxyphosphoribosylaminopyrimidine deaminase/5-amino-6-(5-phosphoribosylamino)uracil reductase